MRRSHQISRFRGPSLVLAVGTLFAAVAGSPAEAAAAASAPFLAPQALYELSLLKSRGSASINSVRGRILYNFSGSACDGYSSDFRQASQLDSGEGTVTLGDLRSTR